MRHQNVLAIVADCRRKQGGRYQGSCQLTVWQWLSVSLRTSRTTNSKQTKKRRQQDTSNYSKPQEKVGRVQTKVNTFFRALLLRRLSKSMWVWFRAHAHKNYLCCMYTVYSGMQEWVIQIPSIPICSFSIPMSRTKLYIDTYIDVQTGSKLYGAHSGSPQ